MTQPGSPTVAASATEAPDSALLAFETGALEPYRDLSVLERRYRRSAERVRAALVPHMPAGGPLLSVASTYAAMTLRQDYTGPQDPSLAFPLFLLSAWIWDDLVDTNKGGGGCAAALREGLPRLTQAVLEGVFERSPASLGRFRAPIELAATQSAALHRFTEVRAPHYADRIEREVVRFLASFERKVDYRHNHRDVESFVNSRIVCVGMQPCYEFAYAFKAVDANMDPASQLAYLELPQVQPCADLATLHCAAVNDLFSMYKDRCLEDTANFPSVLGGSDDLGHYFVGAQRTIAYLRRVYRQFESQCARLPDLPGKPIVTQSWIDMMEGNLLFHLMVPRYREGVELVGYLLDSTLSEDRQRERFMAAFASSAADVPFGRPGQPAVAARRGAHGRD